MRRKIANPRVLLLDCPLEYKKGDSATNVEITKEEDWNTLLRIEEEYIEHMCAQIVAVAGPRGNRGLKFFRQPFPDARRGGQEHSSHATLSTIG